MKQNIFLAVFAAVFCGNCCVMGMPLEQRIQNLADALVDLKSVLQGKSTSSPTLLPKLTPTDTPSPKPIIDPEFNELSVKYPSIFEGFSTKQQKFIFDEMGKKAAEKGESLEGLVSSKKWTVMNSRVAVGKMLVGPRVYYGFDLVRFMEKAGYYFFGSIGESEKFLSSSDDSVPSRLASREDEPFELLRYKSNYVWTIPDGQVAAFKGKMVKNYKIHLMPRYRDISDEKDINIIFARIAERLVRDDQFAALVFDFKIKVNQKSDADLILSDASTIFPRIVIYPGSGKEITEKLLNELLILLKDIPGSGITPRFNEKVTDLIFVAQGDGDFKEDSDVAAYKSRFGTDPYEEPGRVYYNPNLTGTMQNYHLKWTLPIK